MQQATTFMTMLLLIGSAAGAWATGPNPMKDAALKMAPDSKLVLEDGDEFSFQTPKGTLIEIEMNRDGSVDEASGDSAALGDVFFPGGGLLDLSQAVASLKKSGKSPSGDWSFEKSMLNGWVYEFEGIENGKKREYTIDAKDGKLIRDRRDF